MALISAFKAGLDIRPLGARGVGRYLAGLLEGLSSLHDDFELTLFAGPRSDLSLLPKDPRFKIEPVKASPPFAEQSVIPKLALELGLHVLHFPDNSGAINPGVPMVLTMHDGMWQRPLKESLLRPTLRQRLQDRYRKFVCPRAAKAAARVITVSQFSAHELSQSLDLGSKLSVVPNALSDAFKRRLPQSEAKRLAAALGLKKPFFFCSGAADRRKNISRVIRAFAKSGLKEAELVVTSLRPGEIHTTDYLQVAAEAGLGRRVHFLAYLQDEALKALYQLARGYLFPSLWEGFGLPVLEAYAMGCPLLCSRAGALPEVAGKGAIFADPESEEDLARGLRQLWKADRARMAAKGRKELGRYSWKKSAAKTLEVWKEAAACR